jgi:hypothetical protein
MNAASKAFPANYSKTVLHILGTASMTGLKNLEVVGSASIRSQLYAGDYDTTDKVNTTIPMAASKLKDIVKNLRMIKDCYIGDIKCGEVPDWDVFQPTAHYDVAEGKIMNFNIVQSKSVVDSLRKEKIISPEEARGAYRLLEKATTPLGFLEARKEIRFHILRWTPQSILEGVLHYRGYSFPLEDAMASGGLIKLDMIANIDDRYTELSMIYELYVNGKLITKKPTDLTNSLKEDIEYYESKNPFKALKRMFSLARVVKDNKSINHLVPLLNSDLGRLYQIIGDMSSLHTLLERPSKPVAEIRFQLDEMKARFGNLYQMKDFLAKEHDIIGVVEALLKQPDVSKLKSGIYALITRLQNILNTETLRAVRGGS